MLKFLRSDRLWLSSFLVLFAVGILSHLLTLSFSPLPWLDEVEIVEMVRGGVVRTPIDNGLHYYCQSDAMNAQSWALFYVGGWIQNAFYDLFGACGPRLASLLGLVLLTVFCFDYAQRKTGSVKFACVFATIASTFQLFIQSVRGGRVDVWTLVLLFLSLAILERYSEREGKSRILVPALVGGVACLSIFTWVTSFLLGPIYLWALIGYARHDRRVVKTLAFSVLGFVLTLLVLLVPFARAEGALANFVYVMTTVSGASNQQASWVPAARCLWSYMLLPPCVCLLGIAMLLASRRSWILKIGVGLYFVTVVIVCAHVYIYRVVYFVPYALLGLCLFYASANRFRKCLLLLLVCVAACCYGRGVVIRNGIEYLTKEGRSSERVKRELERRIGRSASVYCETHQLYYIGRELGWRQFKFVEGFNIGAFDKCGIEWFVGEEKLTISSIVDDLKTLGFVRQENIAFTPPACQPLIEKILTRADRARCYGPYVVYRRAKTHE